MSKKINFAVFIIRVILYIGILGALITDAFTHAVLDKVDVRWWSMFLILEIWFSTVAMKTMDSDK